MQKPYRFVVDRVVGYADEAGAYLRRRRLRARPFARVRRPDGSIEVHDGDGDAGRELFAAAAGLLSEKRGA